MRAFLMLLGPALAAAAVIGTVPVIIAVAGICVALIISGRRAARQGRLGQ